MILYFADRTMQILGMASTELPEGLTIADDLKSEDIDSGVATFECTIPYNSDNRALVESCTAAGNYLLRSNDGENEFYTILETEADTKNQTVYIYAEDAGMDLLNEVNGAYEASEAMPISDYIEYFANDTGFVIGINEISNLTRTLSWEGEATTAERLASVATQFDNAEISYSFDVQGLEVTNKYINIYKQRGKDAGIQLRLNKDIDRIITKSSVADLATSLKPTGGIPDGEEDAITLKGYEYDDGDFYVTSSGRLNSREALKKWSRYVWEKEPNQQPGYTGHIVKQYSYDTTSQSELCNRAISELKDICDVAVNYEVEITTLPDNVKIGDTVYIVDDDGELYLSARILELTTSICNQKQTATLGDYLIQDSGISQTVADLAAQFSELAKSRTYYTWIAYADDEEGTNISLDSTGKKYMGIASNRTSSTVDLSDPSVFTWSLIQGSDGSYITSNTITYQSNSSGTEAPEDENGWSTSVVEASQGEYLWTKVETTYSTGETSTSYSVSYIAIDGLDELSVKQIIANEGYITSLEVNDLLADYVTTEDLSANYAEIETLVSGYVKADTLEATIAAFGYVTAGEVEALVGNFGYLTADSATITTLTADVANINSVLAGNVGTGSLEAVRITSDNVVFDDAVINNAAIVSLSASKLTAGTIYTSFITIQTDEDDRSLYIADDLIAMYDANDVMRLQAGSTDSLTGGNNGYNFVIWDADGAQLFNATGITAAGIPSETIVNDHVAENAAISGTKLDITSVATALNEDGSITVDYANVQVNETTLDYALTSITSNTEAAQAAAEEAQATADAAQTTATQAAADAAQATTDAAAAQTAADEAATAAATAQAAADTATTNAASAKAAADEAQAAVDAAQEEYDTLVSRTDATEEELAAAQEKLTAAQEAADAAQSAADTAATEAAAAQEKANAAAADAATAQTTADNAAAAASTAQETAEAAQQAADDAQAAADAVASRTTTLETELEIVQGYISMIVSETDIAELKNGDVTLYELYSSIQLTLDGINLSVSELTTAVSNIGGRNYILNSGNFTADSDTDCVFSSGSSFSTYWSITAYDGYLHIECIRSTTNVRNIFFYLSDSFDASKTYILSARIRTGETSDLPVQLYSNTDSGSYSTGDSITPSAADTWETITITIDPTSSSYELDSVGFSLTNYKTLGDYIDIEWIQLEQGSIPTDWTPAPEDTDSAITTNYEELTSRISTIEMSLDEITLSVSSVQSKIENLSIGTRNYVRYSGGYEEGGDTSMWTLSTSTISTYYSITSYDGYMRWECITSSTSTTTWIAFLPLSDAFDSTVDHIVTIRLRLSTAAAVYFYCRYANSSGTYLNKSVDTNLTASTATAEEWFDYTFTLDGQDSYDYEYFGIGLTFFHSAVGQYIDIAQVKIETGTVATDWTPAPEDTNDIISTLTENYANLVIDVNSITTEVGSIQTSVDSVTSQISTIEQTVSNISLSVNETVNLFPENLIADGTFENYTTFGSSVSWYRSNSSYIGINEYDSKPCVRFTRGGSGYYIRQTVNAPAGTYMIKMKIACDESYAPVIRVGLGSTYAYLCSDGDLTADWVTYSATITITSSTTYFYAYCYSAEGVTTATTAIAYITDIVMYDTSEFSTAVSASLVLSIETDSDGNKYGAITANADYVYFTGGDLVIDMDNVSIAADGTAQFGGWTISSNRIYTVNTDTSDEDYGKYTVLRKAESSSNWVFAAGGTDTTTYSAYPFRVAKSGKLYCENTTVSRLFGLDSNGDQRTLAYLDSDTDYYYYGYGDVTNRIYLGSTTYTDYLMLNGSTIRAYGEFYCYGWGNTTLRKPIQTVSTDGAQTVYMSTGINSSGTYYATINGQYGTTGSTYSSHNFAYASSDIRLKEHIADTEVEAMPVIRQMKLRQFDWKQNSIHQDIGFVADELEEIKAAFSIGGGEDEEGQPNYKSIDTLYLIGYIVKGLQELDTRLSSAGL